MAKPKVFATHSLFDAARKILNEACDVEYWAKPERPPREEVLQRVKDKDGLICLLTEKINEELLGAAPKLRIAANVAVGFVDADDGGGAAVKRGRSAGAFGKLEELEFGSTCRDGCVGEDAGDRRIREDWTSGGAARERISDEGDLYGCGARSGRRGERIEGGVPGDECVAGKG